MLRDFFANQPGFDVLDQCQERSPGFELSRLGAAVSIPGRLPTQCKSEFEAQAVKRACPVCDSRNAEPYWQKGELRLVRCTKCGMVYASPIPAGMAAGEFYDAAGKDYYLSPAKLESDYADVRFERELRLFRRFCARGAVLDVGCSSGAFLFQLNKRWPGDYEILGTDVSGAPLDYAESRGVPVMRGNFLELSLSSAGTLEESKSPHPGPLPTGWGEGGRRPGDRCDAVTFWAVLEHLAEPKRFLQKAHAILKPGGLCFVLVPNLKSLAVRLLGARYRYIYPQHLNYFTAQTLRRLIEPHFSIVQLRTTHFNPIIIWQDFRDQGREVSNVERAELLKRTTGYKQSAAMKPVQALYRATEKILGALKLADNLAAVLQKR
jgi:SAM-dependent methyltransferase